MQIIHIDHRMSELEDAGQKIVVRSNGHRKATLPMRLVERLVVTSSSKISTSLLLKLNRQGTGVLVIPTRYSQGSALHVVRSDIDHQLICGQMKLSMQHMAKMSLATHFVETKLRGHRALLEELGTQKPRHRQALTLAAGHLARAIEKLKIVPADEDKLRGAEGAASAQFFRAWGRCFPTSLKFSTRNRRPPLDPVNVCLSIGYTLAHHEALISVAVLGLDTQTGFLHEPLANRDSLACDIVETARPIVDRWVVELFANSELRPEHFTLSSKGCLVGKTGRKILYEHYFETAAEKVTAICSRQAIWLRSEIISRNHLVHIEAAPKAVRLGDEE